MKDNLVREFFLAVDSLDLSRFTDKLHPDVVWRFGNGESLRGRTSVEQAYIGILSILVKMDHEVLGVWDAGDCVTVETTVTYGHKSGKSFTYPACDIIEFDGDLVKDIKIFIDCHEMIATPI